MVTCELCGKETRTSQGLRGHKTFVHGIRANSKKLFVAIPDDQDMYETSRLKSGKNDSNEFEDSVNKPVSEIKNITETLVELKRTVNYLQGWMVSLASRNELRRIVLEVDRLNNQVKKHDQWLNPRGLHEAVIGLSGGPIADLERSLGSHRFSNNLARKKLRLKPRVSVK